MRHALISIDIWNSKIFLVIDEASVPKVADLLLDR